MTLEKVEFDFDFFYHVLISSSIAFRSSSLLNAPEKSEPENTITFYTWAQTLDQQNLNLDNCSNQITIFLLINPFVQLFKVQVGGAVATRSVHLPLFELSGFKPLPVTLCCVLGQTFYSHSASLSTQVYQRVPANLMMGATLRWTSIPSREE